MSKKSVPGKNAEQLIGELENKLIKMDPEQVRSKLFSICRQTVAGKKGKRHLGEYRDFVDNGPGDPAVFMNYLLEKIQSYLENKTDVVLQKYINTIKKIYNP